MDELRPGSAVHVGTVAVSILVMAVFARQGRVFAADERERSLRRTWAAGIFFVAAFLFVRAFWPPSFDARYNLPLHLCDVAFPLAGLALWTERRALVCLVYFWAIGLSTQAFFTPILRVGPAHLDFWLFWLYHVQLVGAAVYAVIVRGFRPTGRDYLLACGATVAYALVILPLNLAFGWSYGFLGPDDSLGRDTLLEQLPPWPWRLAAMFVLTMAGMAVLWLVWPLGAWLRGRRVAG